MKMKVVATIYTDFSEKFGSPRQGALAHESEGIIVFEPSVISPFEILASVIP